MITNKERFAILTLDVKGVGRKPVDVKNSFCVAVIFKLGQDFVYRYKVDAKKEGWGSKAPKLNNNLKCLVADREHEQTNSMHDLYSVCIRKYREHPNE